MATIRSFPLRQQHPSKSYIGTSNFPVHFGIKTRINRMFAWCNKLLDVHTFVLLLCTHLCFWLPLMSSTSTEMMELSPNEINGSLTENEQFGRAYAKRCSLLSIPVDNINSYKSMSILIVFLCIGYELFISVAQIVYRSVSREQLDNPYRWFCWCRKVLLYLVGSSICHQLASALACRPMEILYNLRYTSMLVVQMAGFVICLLFAFFLGVKFASIKPMHRLSKSSNTSYNNVD